VGTNTGLSLGEGTTASVTSSQLSASADASDPASELVYTVTTLPTHGTLKLSGTAVALNGTFTQNDVNTGKVTFTQDGSDNKRQFRLLGGDAPGSAATGTFSITFTEAAATVGTNTGLSLGEGTTASVTSSKLSASADASDPASELVYTVTTLATHGHLETQRHRGGTHGTFTQDDVNTGKVTFTQDGSDNNDNFAFSVATARARPHRHLRYHLHRGRPLRWAPTRA